MSRTLKSRRIPRASILRFSMVRVVLAALAGGSTFVSCTTRFGDAVALGTRNYISSLFSPENLAEFFPSEEP